MNIQITILREVHLTMNITSFHNDRYEVARPLTPTLPNGRKAEGVTLFLKSTGSKEAMEWVSKINAQLAETELVKRQTGDYIFDWEKRREYDINLACAVFDRFTGIVDKEGEVLVCNEENKRLLMDEYDWLRVQLLEEAQDLAEYELKEQAH